MPATVGVHVQGNERMEPGNKSTVVRSNSAPSTKKATSMASALTLPMFITSVVMETGSPTCGMLTSMVKLVGTINGSGRRSFTP